MRPLTPFLGFSAASYEIDLDMAEKTTDRKAHKRRLERAGFRFYSGWLPEKNPRGPQFAQQVEMHREDVAKVLAEPVKPRGRPRKS